MHIWRLMCWIGGQNSGVNRGHGCQAGWKDGSASNQPASLLVYFRASCTLSSEDPLVDMDFARGVPVCTCKPKDTRRALRKENDRRPLLMPIIDRNQPHVSRDNTAAINELQLRSAKRQGWYDPCVTPHSYLRSLIRYSHDELLFSAECWLSICTLLKVKEYQRTLVDGCQVQVRG